MPDTYSKVFSSRESADIFASEMRELGFDVAVNSAATYVHYVVYSKDRLAVIGSDTNNEEW